MSSITVAGVQFDGLPGNVGENLGRMVRLIDDAAAQGAALVAFPEVAVSDYFGTDFASLASPVPALSLSAVRHRGLPRSTEEAS